MIQHHTWITQTATRALLHRPPSDCRKPTYRLAYLPIALFRARRLISSAVGMILAWWLFMQMSRTGVYCQAPQDLLDDLQATSRASLLASQRSQQSIQGTTTKMMIQADSPGITGLSESSGTLPAPPTAFPQRQIVSHLAISTSCQQPVVAVVYSQSTPMQENDGSIINVQRDTNSNPAALLGLGCESIVALWSLRDESNASMAPGAVLICHSPLVCCDLKPVGCPHTDFQRTWTRNAGATVGFIIVGGCTDGSICVWDTRSLPHMHCSWQGARVEPPPVDKSSQTRSQGLRIGDLADDRSEQQQSAVYAPVFSSLCSSYGPMGAVLSESEHGEESTTECQGLEQLEAISQVAFVPERQAREGSDKHRDASGNISLLVLTATGVVSLWAVVVSRGVDSTAAGSFLLQRNGTLVTPDFLANGAAE
jgi:hypothetical protein